MEKTRRAYEVVTEKYGEKPCQEGDLYLPRSAAKGTICLFHGGFWKMPYDRFQLDGIAGQLAQNGFVLWNVEYGRTGSHDGGWPGTFEDAVRAVNYLLDLKTRYPAIDPQHVILAGHSAGGHLALWLGRKGKGVTGTPLLIRPRVLIGLAPVVDLIRSFEEQSGGDAVYQLLGCAPSGNRERYSLASPMEMLPFGIPQLLMHGTEDEAIPIDGIRRYVGKAESMKEDVTLIEVEKGRHMDFLDPGSRSAALLIRWLNAYCEGS